MEKHFPNGFSAWQETHFEIVQAITIEHMKDEPSGIVAERHAEQGHGGLYELAEELTDEFETRYANFEWDGNFFDVIEDYIKEKRVVVWFPMAELDGRRAGSTPAPVPHQNLKIWNQSKRPLR